MGQPRILITGFSAFPGVPQNPTERLVEEMAERDGARDAQFLILPVEYEAVTRWVDHELPRLRPDILIMLGYTAGARSIRLEGLASDLCAPELADAAGALPPVLEERQPSHVATLPLDAIEAALGAEGIACERSEDCGSYLCNYLFYGVQSHIARQSLAVQSGFIHFPAIRFEDGTGLPAESENMIPVSQARRALAIVLACCREEFSSPDHTTSERNQRPELS